jgi:hypothetical protein
MMSNATQYKLKHKELVELLIKANGVHEGRWMLNVDFGMAPGNFGPSENEISPGIMVAVQSVGIQRDTNPASPLTDALVVDAAVVNPKK